MTETVAAILAAHRAGALSPAQTIVRSFQRIRDHDDPALFISLRDERQAVAEAEALSAKKDALRLPLYGIPVAVKDNIDVAGLPTTAACPAFAYTPVRDATSVARLRAAGAIIVGKTNLDQFATGLVGVRSPYGIPKNPLRGDLIPGGSSSGSAVAVSAGLVPLALGTDTAGSGRVPAMFNNIVGLKPGLGLVSTTGVVPACRTLDCVSIFSLTVDDAVTALSAMAGPDAADPYSRDRPLAQTGAFPAHLRLGVPRSGQLIFFGDKTAEAAFAEALQRWTARGATLVEFDLEPLYETARLLYEGPWVAERYLVIRDLLASSPDAIHPVMREITIAGARPSRQPIHSARCTGCRDCARRPSGRLPASTRWCCRRRRPCIRPRRCWPTRSNSIPASAPIPISSTCSTSAGSLCRRRWPATIPRSALRCSRHGQDAQLASIGRVFHADTKFPMGANKLPQPPLAALPAGVRGDEIAIAVVGAHLSGMALNGELKALGGRLLEAARTAADYRLYALKTTPPKPGMLRVEAGTGSSIELEVWALPAAAFGKFVAAVPPPLSIGTVRLADGRGVKGFIVEAADVAGAREISAFGGWRAFVAEGRGGVRRASIPSW